MDRSLFGRDVWRMRSPSFVLAPVLAGFMLFLGVRGLWLPGQAAHGFGLPLLDGDAHWPRIEAARDLSVGLAIAGLMGFRMRSALGVLLLAGGSPSGHVAFALAVHGGVLLRPSREQQPSAAKARAVAGTGRLAS